MRSDNSIKSNNDYIRKENVFLRVAAKLHCESFICK